MGRQSKQVRHLQKLQEQKSDAAEKKNSPFAPIQPKKINRKIPLKKNVRKSGVCTHCAMCCMFPHCSLIACLYHVDDYFLFLPCILNNCN